ncbi:MAG TPA: DUF2232 domain-containing protein [Bdellovibrionales bacterium]|nr:DUF2232 domain-containing protein [Bdellovibrionales bacterium]
MKLVRSISLVLGAVLLSLATIVLSSIPLIVLRRVGGSGYYWILSLMAGLVLVFSGHVALWAPFLSIVILVGLYAELESNGFKIETAGLLSLAGTCTFVGLNLAALQNVSGLDLLPFVRDGVGQVVDRLQLMEPTLKLDVNTIVPQIPSAIVILLMFSLWISLVVDRRLGLSATPAPELSQFALPDFLVWVFLAGVVGSFVELGDQAMRFAGQNLFNVMIYAYFLQGMAIVGTFFKVFKVGLFWRAFGYFVLIGQLFLLVSFVGFVDLWIDIRRRLLKKSAETMGEV